MDWSEGLIELGNDLLKLKEEGKIVDFSIEIRPTRKPVEVNIYIEPVRAVEKIDLHCIVTNDGFVVTEDRGKEE